MLVSAVTGEGIDALDAAIEARLAAGRVLIELDLDPADGAGVSWLHRHTEVIRKTVDENGRVAMTVRADAGQGRAVRAKFAFDRSSSATAHEPVITAAKRGHSAAFASSHNASISASVASAALCRAPRARARSRQSGARISGWSARSTASGSASRCRARLTAANRQIADFGCGGFRRRRRRARLRSRRSPRGSCAAPRADRSSRSRPGWPWPEVSARGSGQGAPPAPRPARRPPPRCRCRAAFSAFSCALISLPQPFDGLGGSALLHRRRHADGGG